MSSDHASHIIINHNIILNMLTDSFKMSHTLYFQDLALRWLKLNRMLGRMPSISPNYTGMRAMTTTFPEDRACS